MQSISRHYLAALLLLLLISHAAFSLHVTTHISAELANCEFCTNHANPAHAIPPATGILLPPVAVYVVDHYFFPRVFGHAEFHPYQQRAPPFSV